MLDFEKIAKRTRTAYINFVNTGFTERESMIFVSKMLEDIIFDVEREEKGVESDD